MKMEDMVLFSVDDHIIEPPDMFEGRIPKTYGDAAPKHHSEGGVDYWTFGGQRMYYTGTNAVAGRPRDEYGFEPSSLSQMRRGCYDVDARIGDMNVNGVAASVNFGTFVGMAGEPFLKQSDKDLALATLQAWNDWHIEAWCAAYPDRLVPMAITPLWSPELIANEIRRVNAKGCDVIAFHPNPVVLGLPSFHTDHWDPVWQACTERDMTICMHFADSSYAVPSPDSPIDVFFSNMPIGLYRVVSDLIYTPALRKFPDLRFAMSEAGVGWVPYMKERIDYTHRHHSQWTRQDFGDKRPSELFERHFLSCFIDDPVGIYLRRRVGIRNISWEADYPHADGLWPKAPEKLYQDLLDADVPDDEIDLITHQNAARVFKFDPFKLRPREQLTVGALRKAAAAAGVDTAPLRTNRAGHAPSEKDAGPVSMHEIARLRAINNASTSHAPPLR
ncbi:MAG: amidohydrolase family protein [Rhizorhabdus sp.]